MPFTFQKLDAAEATVCVPLAGVPLPERYRLFRDTLNLLGATLAATRRKAEIPRGRRAQFEVIFGYGLLSLNEARALWALLSCGLEAQANVHARSIGEHATHVTMLLRDESIAQKVYDSLGAAERELAEEFDLSDEIETALREGFAPVLEVKPDRKVLGDMRKALDAHGYGAFDYAVYRVLSQVEHGSVIALRKLASLVAPFDKDFIERSSVDGSAEMLVFLVTHLMLIIIAALEYISGVEIDDAFNRIVADF